MLLNNILFYENKFNYFLSEFNLGGAGNSLFKLCKKISKKKKILYISYLLNKCYYKKEFINCGVSVYEVNSSKTIFAMPKIKRLLIKLIDKKKKIYFYQIFIIQIFYLFYF